MSADTISMDRMYQETHSAIRATDDTSFKLMGLVPLVSGATLLTFFLKDPIPSNKATLVLSLAVFAALITLGFFRWELRNIQTCSWLRRRAEALEKAIVMAAGAPKQPLPPLRIGKTEAEKWIYSVTILAWLSVPQLVCPLDRSTWLFAVYLVVAGLVLAITALSVLGSVRVAKPVS